MKRRGFVAQGSIGTASVLLGSSAALLGCSDRAEQASSQSVPSAGEPLGRIGSEWQGTVLQAAEGTFIVSGRRRAPMRVKVDSAQAPGVAMSMLVSEVGAGLSIPVHLHRNEDEIIFIHTGEGVVTLGEQRVPSSAGAMLYAPRGVWHGVDNTGAETLTWCAIWSPAGFEQYFIEAASLMSRQVESAPTEELNQLAARYGMVFRDG